MPKILIATPCYGGQATAQTSSAVTLAIDEARRCGWEARWLVNHASADIADSRNKFLGIFLVSTCDYLMFWDADVACGPGNFGHLLQHSKDLVAGLYRTKNDAETVYPVQWPEQPEVIDDDGIPLLKAKAVPAGFLRLSRHCIETMAKRDGVNWIEQDDTKGRTARYPFLFDWTWIVENGINKRESEDYTFCRRWREAGGECWVDPALKLNHVGQKVFAGDFMQMIERENRERERAEMRASFMRAS